MVHFDVSLSATSKMLRISSVSVTAKWNCTSRRSFVQARFLLAAQFCLALNETRNDRLDKPIGEEEKIYIRDVKAS